jgi:hypothetical protein
LVPNRPLPTGRRAALTVQVRSLVRAIREGDDATVEAAVRQLSSRRRLFAPLGLVVGAFVMLFQGLKLLISNWRLTLVQLLPAMWIWVAMFDFKAHMFYGKSFYRLHGAGLLVAILGIAIITAASFYLNAVFAYAIATPGKPEIRPAFARTNSHASMVLGAGAIVGVLLGMAALYTNRWGHHWFAISMSFVLAIMMLAYVAVPSRLIGMKTTHSRGDKFKATAVGGALGAVICTPPYVLARVGILMLGSHLLFIPGIFVLTLGVTLQAGATSAVKAIKMSAKLVAGHDLAA